MRISTFFYTLKQGIINISLASIATIGACLFLFGLFYSVLLNVQSIVRTAQEGISVTVLFDDGISQERIEEIGSLIRKRPEVSDVKFTSADEAWESFKEEYLGEYSDGFTENPLENSASYISLGIIAILFAVSVFLISNTVTIGIAVRKEEITIMKYIGATDFFVRSPFVIEGMMIGAIGAVIPLGIIFVVYNQVLEFILTKFSMLTKLLSFVPVEEVFSQLLPVSVALGVGIGFLGSIVTVRKHLRV